MKKLLTILLSIALMAISVLSFTGCGPNGDNNGSESYTSGTFYSVTQAYENEYLTLEQVKSIAYYYNGGTKYNEDIMGEDYAPLPKTPKELSAEAKTNIIESFYNSSRWDQYENFFSKDDIGCGLYLGTYGGAIVVRIVVDGEGVDDSVFEEEIDGVIIFYTNGSRLSVWVGDK